MRNDPPHPAPKEAAERPQDPTAPPSSDLIARILARAEQVPDAVALVEGKDDRTTTYGELRARVLRLRDGLVAAGFEPGDRVLAGLRPGVTAVVAALGVAAAGGSLVVIDPGAGPELFAARVRLAAPRWVIAESALYTLNRLLPRLARRRGLLLPGLTGLATHHVYTGPWLPGVPRGAHRLERLRGPATEEVRDDRSAPAAEEVRDEHSGSGTEGVRDGSSGAGGGEVRHDPHAAAVVVFTSGTTAEPRGVVHSAASLAAGLELCRERFPLGPDDVVHDSGFMLGLPALLAGSRWSVPSLGGDEAGYLEELERRGVTHTFCVPVYLARLLDHAPRLPAALKFVLLGSAPVPPAVLRRAVAAAAPTTTILSVYAMTEMLPISMADAQEKFDQWAAEDGDLLGTPLPGVEVKVAPDGELLLRGPNACLGYLGEPPLDWLATGDLVRLDAKGRLVLIGRKKDMLIRGSTNIYPGLYEPAIAALQGVAEAAMVGLPDPATQDEQVVVAVVPDGTVPGAELAAGLHRALPTIIDRAALPDRIEVLPDLPRSGRSHKLDRQALRTLLTDKPPAPR